MTYEDLIKSLRSSNIFASMIVNVDRINGERVVGLSVNTSALSMDRKIEVVKKICGDEYKVKGMKNEEYILIEKKLE